ncbi:hypothetical protein BT96DRAFT_951846, partial [Gymnopus androsaceus JB14]
TAASSKAKQWVSRRIAEGTEVLQWPKKDDWVEACQNGSDSPSFGETCTNSQERVSPCNPPRSLGQPSSGVVPTAVTTCATWPLEGAWPAWAKLEQLPWAGGEFFTSGSCSDSANLVPPPEIWATQHREPEQWMENLSTLSPGPKLSIGDKLDLPCAGGELFTNGSCPDSVNLDIGRCHQDDRDAESRETGRGYLEQSSEWRDGARCQLGLARSRRYPPPETWALQHDTDVKYIRILPRSPTVYWCFATGLIPAGVAFLTGNVGVPTCRYGCQSHPYPAKETSPRW